VKKIRHSLEVVQKLRGKEASAKLGDLRQVGGRLPATFLKRVTEGDAQSGSSVVISAVVRNSPKKRKKIEGRLSTRGGLTHTGPAISREKANGYKKEEGSRTTLL